MKERSDSRLPEDVAHLLGDDPELLAVADAIRTTYRIPGHRRAHALAATSIALVTVGVAAAAVLGLFASGTSFVGAARAALGGGNVFHAVVVLHDPEVVMVSPNGKSRPVVVRDEFWFDLKTRSLRTRSLRDGRIVVDTASSRAPLPDPELYGFVSGYADAVRSEGATTVASGSFAGHPVQWLSFEVGEQVAVSTKTHLPLALRVVAGHSSETWRVSAVSMQSAPALAPARSPHGLIAGSILSSTRVPASRVAAEADFTPAVASSSAGWLLSTASVDTLVSRDAAGRRSVARGLTLTYREGRRTVTISESPRAVPAYAFLAGLTFDFVPVPQAGWMVAAHVGDGWLVQFNRYGLFISVRSARRADGITLARRLRPLD